MREILFRGKYSDNDWVVGDLIQEDNTPSIRENIHTEYRGLFNCYAVYSETIGQYTGIDDKNGVKVFEGDIVKGTRYPNDEFIGVVIWDDKTASFFIEKTYLIFVAFDPSRTFEVIGNKFDNPELLEA